MLLGAHESAAGGCDKVFERASRDGAQAVQLWTRSSRKWASRELPDDEVRAFRAAHAQFRDGRAPTAAHASYLINLASGKPEIRARSIATLHEECERAERLAIDHVILHVGAHQHAGVDAGIDRVAAALREVLSGFARGAKLRVLVEFTAGQGTCLGCSFQELDAILQATGDTRLGVCLDTQHMYAAGIDWTTARGYEQTMREFEQIVGFSQLRAFHLNDSKTALGSRVDRHQVIGEGHIGLAPFARLLADPRLARLPAYLETPPLSNGEESFALGLARLRSLLGTADKSGRLCDPKLPLRRSLPA